MDLEYKCNLCGKISRWHISVENISNFVCKTCGEFIGSSNGKVVRFVHPPSNMEDFRFTEHVSAMDQEIRRRHEEEMRHSLDDLMRRLRR